MGSIQRRRHAVIESAGGPTDTSIDTTPRMLGRPWPELTAAQVRHCHT
jgi:hypothetical protein